MPYCVSYEASVLVMVVGNSTFRNFIVSFHSTSASTSTIDGDEVAADSEMVVLIQDLSEIFVVVVTADR